MKLAIPIWEGKVSPVFDTASRLLVLQIDGRQEVSRFETYLDEQDITRRCLRLRGLEIQVLICGAVSRHLCMMLLSMAGIEVIPWVSGPVQEVLDAYLKGELFHSRFLMPGCRWQREERGRGCIFCGKDRTTRSCEDRSKKTIAQEDKG